MSRFSMTLLFCSWLLFLCGCAKPTQNRSQHASSVQDGDTSVESLYIRNGSWNTVKVEVKDSKGISIKKDNIVSLAMVHMSLSPGDYRILASFNDPQNPNLSGNVVSSALNLSKNPVYLGIDLNPSGDGTPSLRVRTLGSEKADLESFCESDDECMLINKNTKNGCCSENFDTTSADWISIGVFSSLRGNLACSVSCARPAQPQKQAHPKCVNKRCGKI